MIPDMPTFDSIGALAPGPKQASERSWCHSCGACCNPVETVDQRWIDPARIAATLEMWEKGKFEAIPDNVFVAKVLIPIPLREAEKRNPFLKAKRGASMRVDDTHDPMVIFGFEDERLFGIGMVDLNGRFPYNYLLYECPNYDLKNRLCKVHGTPEKPRMCSEFPFYGYEKLDRISLDPRCGYNAVKELE